MPTEIAVPQTVMQILALAVLRKDASIEVVEKLCALQRQMGQDDAESEFNAAMNRCQQKMKRINANMENPQTRSRYADYAQIDRAIRPIYTEEGFSLSFSDGEPLGPDMVRILCYVSHRSGDRMSHTRMYHKDMPVVTVGPQGKAVMTPTHATGSADAYAKRYLVKDIFNLAIGEDDDDGNGGLDTSQREELVNAVSAAKTMEELKPLYVAAMKQASAAKDKTLVELLTAAKDERKAKLAEAINA
jgi:hypothetical protein